MGVLAEELPREIARVAKLQGHCEAMRGTPGANFEFMIANMSAAVDEAVAACGAGDVVAMLRSFELLKAYKS